MVDEAGMWRTKGRLCTSVLYCSAIETLDDMIDEDRIVLSWSDIMYSGVFLFVFFFLYNLYFDVDLIKLDQPQPQKRHAFVNPRIE